jgi:hypothetical protein
VVQHVVNDEPSVSGINVAPSGDAWTFGVVGKRTYDVSGGRCHVAREQVALVEKPLAAEDRISLVHDSDRMVTRSLVDVVVRGHAHAQAEVEQFDVAVSIGPWGRAMRVFGDRRCETDLRGSCRFSPAERTAKVPLDWARAYGGTDAAAIRRYGDPVEHFARKTGLAYDPRFGFFAYARNPLGRGFLVDDDPASYQGRLLPNFEDPGALLRPESLALGDFRAWPRAPMPAGFGWLPYGFFPRCSLAGVSMRPFHHAEIPPEAFAEVKLGAMSPAELRAAAVPGNGGQSLAQGAAVGMRALEVTENAAVSLTHLHPTQRDWHFALTTPAPRMHLRLPFEEPMELSPRIRTVLIEPDLDRVVVVWVGEARFEAPPTDEQFAAAQHAVVWQD